MIAMVLTVGDELGDLGRPRVGSQDLVLGYPVSVHVDLSNTYTTDTG